ncbi:MAG: hypothetical protein U0361_10935 [Nitrospiraceae bacterium]
MLQQLARALGLRQVRYLNPSTRAATLDESNPFFRFDNAVCVSCARCVRACEEIQGLLCAKMLFQGLSPPARLPVHDH